MTTDGAFWTALHTARINGDVERLAAEIATLQRILACVVHRGPRWEERVRFGAERLAKQLVGGKMIKMENERKRDTPREDQREVEGHKKRRTVAEASTSFDGMLKGQEGMEGEHQQAATAGDLAQPPAQESTFSYSGSASSSPPPGDVFTGIRQPHGVTDTSQAVNEASFPLECAIFQYNQSHSLNHDGQASATESHPQSAMEAPHPMLPALVEDGCEIDWDWVEATLGVDGLDGYI